MVAIYDLSEFPIVKVDISGSILNDDDFNDFTSKWLNIYKYKTNFEFVFDTKNIKYINPLYCIYTAIFIRSIKKNNPQYLTNSKIIIYNKYIFNLAQYIFYIEKPVAPVELILKNNNNITSVKINT